MKECIPKDWKKKQVRFDVWDNLGSDPTLPTELTTFLAGGTAKEWEDTPHPSTHLSMDPLWPPPSRAPIVIPPTWEGLAQRSLPNPSLLNPNTSHSSKGCQTWWTMLANGSWRRWIGLEPTLAGVRKSGPAKCSSWGAAWEDTSYVKLSLHV